MGQNLGARCSEASHLIRLSQSKAIFQVTWPVLKASIQVTWPVLKASIQVTWPVLGGPGIDPCSGTWIDSRQIHALWGPGIDPCSGTWIDSRQIHALWGPGFDPCSGTWIESWQMQKMSTLSWSWSLQKSEHSKFGCQMFRGKSPDQTQPI